MPGEGAGAIEEGRFNSTRACPTRRLPRSARRSKDAVLYANCRSDFSSREGSTMSRVMDKPADFIKLGVNPNRIEAWEDGRRDTSAPGHAEIWYLDCHFDDGSTLVLGFPKVRGPGRQGR